ncbi:hypothetical protein H0H93_002167, partial [Arthromyces matolae]
PSPSPNQDEFIVLPEQSDQQNPVGSVTNAPQSRVIGLMYPDTPGPSMPGGLGGAGRGLRPRVETAHQPSNVSSTSLAIQPPVEVIIPHAPRPVPSTPFRAAVPESTSTPREGIAVGSTVEQDLVATDKGKRRAGADDVATSDEEETDDARVASTMKIQKQLLYDRYKMVFKPSTKHRLDLYVLAHMQFMDQQLQPIPAEGTTDYIK